MWSGMADMREFERSEMRPGFKLMNHFSNTDMG